MLTATLSKSLGAQGGAVLGSSEVIAHLIDSARTFIFDTGLAPASAGAALAALQVLRSDPGLPPRARLRAGQLRAAALAAGFDATEPAAAVVGVRVGAPQGAMRVAERMALAGVRVGCFRPPTVPDGVSRLRLTARADLTDRDVERAAEALGDAARAAQPARPVGP